MRHGILTLVLVLLFQGPVQGQSYRSEYAGQEQNEIKTLSPEDIDDLLSGKGWGYAKAAELNGYPGPSHILAMAKDINLSADQRNAVQALYDEMTAEARRLGSLLVEKERALNQGFAERTINESDLQKLLNETSEINAQLRFLHLRTHIVSVPVLTNHQLRTYERLRGYESTAGSSHAGH